MADFSPCHSNSRHAAALRSDIRGPMAPIAVSESGAPGAMPSKEGTLSAAQLETFRRDGYLVLPGFFDAAPILARARNLITRFDPKDHPLTKFTTGEGGEDGGDAAGPAAKTKEHVGNRYFLESGDKVRYFVEEDAVAPDGTLNRAPELCVNKCGHALHALDDVFYDLSFSQRVQNLVASLDTLRSPRVLQSMVICKQPSIGGAVPSHNDSTFLYTDPPSATGLWFALEDCTKTNGCLSFWPGSHRWPRGGDDSTSPPDTGAPRPAHDAAAVVDAYGVPRGVNRRFVRADVADADKGTTFVPVARNGAGEEADDATTAGSNGGFRVEECPAGSLVLIHGSVMHKSEHNGSDHSRYIYTFHCIEGDEQRATYDAHNWLQPTPAMPFSQLYSPPPRPTVA